MAVAKLSGSKKSVQFVDEDGNVFFTSTNFLMGMINGKSPTNMVVLTKMAVGVPKDKFPKSKIWDGGLGIDPRTGEKSQGRNADMMNPDSADAQKAKQMFKVEDNVW